MINVTKTHLSVNFFLKINLRIKKAFQNKLKGILIYTLNFTGFEIDYTSSPTPVRYIFLISMH